MPWKVSGSARRQLAVLAALMLLGALLTALVTASPASASIMPSLPTAAIPAIPGTVGEVDWGKIYGLATNPGNCVETELDTFFVIMDNCKDQDGQQFVYDNTTNEILAGGTYFCTVVGPHEVECDPGCLSVQAGASGGNGSLIDVERCENPSTQTWEIMGQSLYNPQSRRCLDDTNGQNLARLQLWDCNFGGNANQNWDIVGYTG
jgi:hypothetical protein